MWQRAGKETEIEKLEDFTADENQDIYDMIVAETSPLTPD